MKQWFPENKIIANSLALTAKRHYVYKLTLNSGHFYIGCTGDLSSRLSQHISAIDMCNTNDKGNRLEFSRKAAEILVDDFGVSIQGIKDIRKFVSVHIIAIVAESRGYALMIERTAIKDNIQNELCLNKM